MNNLKLSLMLKPKKVEDSDKWYEFVDAMGEGRILWYPSAGKDFRDLLFMHPQFYADRNFAPPAYPEIYIHTDYYPWKDESFLDNPLLHDDGRTKIELLEKIELYYGSKLESCDDRYVTIPGKSNLSGKIFLLKVKVTSELYGSFERYVIYFFYENVTFFRGIILANKMKIMAIMNVVDGTRWGGNRCNLKFLELYLGYMDTDWLITDNLKETTDFDFIENDAPLRKAFFHIENTPTSMQHLGQIAEMHYGPVMLAKVGQFKKFLNKEIRKGAIFQRKSIS